MNDQIHAKIVRFSSTARCCVVLWQGRAALWWAVVLQAIVAGEARQQSHVARRNAAMRRARSCGVSPDTIAAAVRLTAGYVREMLRGPDAA